MILPSVKVKRMTVGAQLISTRADGQRSGDRVTKGQPFLWDGTGGGWGHDLVPVSKWTHPKDEVNLELLHGHSTRSTHAIGHRVFFSHRSGREGRHMVSDSNPE